MIGALIQGLISKVGPFLLSFLSANLLEFVLDGIAMAADQLLEWLEKKAKLTPEKADDRRIVYLRKWLDKLEKAKG